MIIRIIRHPLASGTRVFDVHDERHIARIDARMWDGTYRVTFDTGMRGEIAAQDVRLATAE